MSGQSSQRKPINRTTAASDRVAVFDAMGLLCMGLAQILRDKYGLF